MAPAKKGKAKTASAASNGSPPKPFKAAPQSLEPFIEQLSKKHVYIAHIDNKPANLKRKIFWVPVGMNVATVLFFIWRVWYILPWYINIATSGLGYPNETTFDGANATWKQLAWEVGRRCLTITIDFLLVKYVWPGPLEFCVGTKHGSPVRWRWKVGFRDREICVRRSRGWDNIVLRDVFENTESQQILLQNIRQATSPMLLSEKTGYLTAMNAGWTLDWEAMVQAHGLVDKKEIALEAFRTVVLFFHQDHGWLCYDTGEAPDEDRRRAQVFAFRDALAAVGKEELFFRWVEMVQFESSQPGGFGTERQAEAAKKIRELFSSNGIDFDEFWKETIGSDGLAGM